MVTSSFLLLPALCFLCFYPFPSTAAFILCFYLRTCSRLLLRNAPFFSFFRTSWNSDSSLLSELRLSTYYFLICFAAFSSIISLSCRSSHAWYQHTSAKDFPIVFLSAGSFIHVLRLQILSVLLTTFFTLGIDGSVGCLIPRYRLPCPVSISCLLTRMIVFMLNHTTALLVQDSFPHSVSAQYCTGILVSCILRIHALEIHFVHSVLCTGM